MFRSIRPSVRIANRNTAKHGALARAAAATDCVFEAVEHRMHMSATLSSSGGLTVLGTFENDAITIDVNSAANRLTVTDNGVARDFALNKVRSVYVNMLEGNDSFSSSQSLFANMIIYGGGGNDNLFGGGGNDQIYAGNGNDTLTNSLGADTDQVWYHNSTGKVSVTLDDSANDGQSAPGVFGQSYEKDNVRSDIEEVHGSKFDDYLSGESLYNTGATLYGYRGNDYIVGSNKSDALYGESGNDTIFGLNGSDHVYGGQGADLMSGGTGSGMDALHYDDVREGRTSGVTVSLPELTVTGFEG
jgi:Ca2+-binding RTX toxin-like protein